MILKIIGTILGLIASLIGVVVSLGTFFPGNVAGLGDYNRTQTVMQHHDFLGSAILLISIIALVLTLFAFKHHGLKGLFIVLIVLGILLFLLSAAFAGALMLIGGVVGLIGVFAHKNGSSRRGPSVML